MMKHMILLCIFFSSNACAQPKLSVNNTSSENLYPYRYKSGKFGYVNDSLQTRIEPQYDHAELFTEHGLLSSPIVWVKRASSIKVTNW